MLLFVLENCFFPADENGVEGPSESNVYELVIKDLTVQDEGTFICSISGVHSISQNYILTVNSKCPIHTLKITKSPKSFRTGFQEETLRDGNLQ